MGAAQPVLDSLAKLPVTATLIDGSTLTLTGGSWTLASDKLGASAPAATFALPSGYTLANDVAGATVALSYARSTILDNPLTASRNALAFYATDAPELIKDTLATLAITATHDDGTTFTLANSADSWTIADGTATGTFAAPEGYTFAEGVGSVTVSLTYRLKTITALNVSVSELQFFTTDSMGDARPLLDSLAKLPVAATVDEDGTTLSITGGTWTLAPDKLSATGTYTAPHGYKLAEGIGSVSVTLTYQQSTVINSSLTASRNALTFYSNDAEALIKDTLATLAITATHGDGTEIVVANSAEKWTIVGGTATGTFDAPFGYAFAAGVGSVTVSLSYEAPQSITAVTPSKAAFALFALDSVGGFGPMLDSVAALTITATVDGSTALTLANSRAAWAMAADGMSASATFAAPRGYAMADGVGSVTVTFSYALKPVTALTASKLALQLSTTDSMGTAQPVLDSLAKLSATATLTDGSTLTLTGGSWTLASNKLSATGTFALPFGYALADGVTGATVALSYVRSTILDNPLTASRTALTFFDTDAEALIKDTLATLTITATHDDGTTFTVANSADKWTIAANKETATGTFAPPAGYTFAEGVGSVTVGLTYMRSPILDNPLTASRTALTFFDTDAPALIKDTLATLTITATHDDGTTFTVVNSADKWTIAENRETATGTFAAPAGYTFATGVGSVTVSLTYVPVPAACEEKLLVNENFQTWAATGEDANPTVTKTTSFSRETLTYTITGTQVDPVRHDETRFNYGQAAMADKPYIVSDGALIAGKNKNGTIVLSPLASITKVEYLHGATGGSRGWKLWKKADGDADWVVLSSAFADPANGDLVSVTLPEGSRNVSLKLTNLTDAQNAYLFDLKIWGCYTSTSPQVVLRDSVNIAGAGTIARSMTSDTYDLGTELTLTAAENFGYDFVKWTDAAGNTLGERPELTLTLNSDTTAIAVFTAVPTYALTLSIEGSTWGKVTLSPAPTDGKYEAGTIVTAKVVPNAVTSFLYWDDKTSDNERTLKMEADIAITATFDEIPFIVGWDFAGVGSGSSLGGNYYAASENQGLFTQYSAAGVAAGWLARATGSFSPSYPCVQKWTAAADFPDRPRYFEATFSTVEYTNISVTSMMAGNYQTHLQQIVQFSADSGKTFVNVDTLTINSTTWTESRVQLPAEAENVAKLYVRWVPNMSGPVQADGTNVEGTAITNIFVYAEHHLAPDSIAPTLVNSAPAEGSATASANGTIVLTFSERVKAGTGTITLDGAPIAATFGSATATFRYANLGYGTQHTLSVPAGAIIDRSGNAFAGLTLRFATMTRPQPIKKMFDAVIAADGTGDYTTFQAAIDAAPANSNAPWLIFVKNGEYLYKHNTIPASKPNLHFIGQSRDSVIVGDTVKAGDGAYNPSTEVIGSSCYFENITFENTYGYRAQAGPQALAMQTSGDKTVFKNCVLRSFQDTYLMRNHGRAFFLRSRIEGAVDYIYGNGDIFFEECTLYNRRDGGYVVAPDHDAADEWGYVFNSCIMDGDPSIKSFYFGRPWHNAPRAVFLNTVCKIGINPEGWHDMGTIPAVFADYGSVDAQGNPLDISHRKCTYTYKDASGNPVTGAAGKCTLTAEEAAQYTLQNVLSGDDAWNPLEKTEATVAAALTADTTTVAWSEVPYAICYVVYANGHQVAFTLNPTYTPASTDTTIVYTVQAAAESGALSPLSNAVHLTAVPVDQQQQPEVKFYIRWMVNGTVAQADSVAKDVVPAYRGATPVKAADQDSTYAFTGWQPAVVAATADAVYTATFVGTAKPLTGIAATGYATLHAYPNPTTGQLTIVNAQLKVGDKVEVYSLQGTLVKQLTIVSSPCTVDITALPSGTYMVKAGNRLAKVVKK